MIEEYLKALITSMDAKAGCLKKLQYKTDEQTELLKAGQMDWDAFDKLVDEKDAVIDELDKLDDGFQLVFERIKDELEADKARYKSYIAKLQEQIKSVTEQSTALMAAEHRNHDLAAGKFSEEKRKIRQNKTSSKAAANYYASMNQINYIDPQLMDKKK